MVLAAGVPAAVLEEVRIVPGSPGTIRIALDTTVDPVVRRLPATGGLPERLLVDLPNVRLASGQTQVLGGNEAIARVRVGQFSPHTARVVVELATPTAHRVRREGTAVLVDLETATPTPGTTGEPPTAAAKPAEPAPSPPPASTVSGHGDGAAPSFVSLPGGARLVWPAFESGAYDEPFAEPLRDALLRWRSVGTLPPAPPAQPGSPAAALLAADIRLLRAAAGAEEPLAALAAYESAARLLAAHGEAARASFMQGLVAEWLGMGPEAHAAHGRVIERFPDHALAPWARLGVASALRLRHRPKEARQALEGMLGSARGALRCAALRERGRVERAAGETAQAALTFREVARDCPELLADGGTLYELAESLVATGAREEARRLLEMPRVGRNAEEESALDLLLGDLAQRSGDVETARTAWDRILGRKISLRMRVEAERRLAGLERDPRRRIERLLELASEPLPPEVRASLLVEAADARAAAGAAEEALALLGRAADLGPAAAALADARRAALLGETVARLRAAEAWSALVTLYAAQTTAIRSLAGAAERRAIAEALLRVGLPTLAADLLAPLGLANADAESRLTAAEGAIAAGDTATARLVLAALERRPMAAALAPRVFCLRGRLALAEGDLAAAAAAHGPCGDPGFSSALAHGWLARGEAAAAAGAFGEAAEWWRRALAVGPDAATRRAAALGLARVAQVQGDAAALASALDEAARDGTPLVRRAAAALLTASAVAEPVRSEVSGAR